MIRNILSAITCLLLSFPLSAQVKNSCTAADIRRDEIARLVLAHGTEPHNKTTAFDGCRLKAFMLENTDSMRLYYSDNGRSHFDFNNMKYDNIFYPSFDRIYGYGAYAFNS